MGKTVFLCAGHHGAGTGAGGFIDEGLECIKLRDDLSHALRGNGVISLIDQNTASLSSVIRNVNDLSTHIDGESVVIDIHFNSFNKKAHGSEVYIHSQTSNSNKEFAKKLVEMTSETLGIHNRGLRTTAQSQHSRLAMLTKIKAPSMIWEICFCDEKTDSEAYIEHRQELIDNFVKLFV